MRPFILSLLSLFSFLATTVLPVSACMVYVPLEIRVAQAEHIVKGEIVAVKEEGRNEIGTLKITEVLKGNKEVKELQVIWPQPHRGPGIIADGPMRYKVGQSGLWILTNRKGLRASYPGDFSTEEKMVGTVRQAMAALETLKWTREGDLEWAAIVEVKLNRQRAGAPPPKGLAFGQVFPIVRNVGKETQHVLDFMMAETLAVNLLSPKGKEVPKVVNRWNRPNPNAIPGEYAFKAIAPGHTAMISYGLPLPPLEETGMFKATITYKNADHDGKKFEKENVFQGTVEFTVDVGVPTKG